MNKLLRLFLLFVLTLGYISANYDAKKAVDYAHKYVEKDVVKKCTGYRASSTVCPGKWNPAYTKQFDGQNGFGTDCMHFLSQAIHAGGIPWDTEKENGYYSVWFDTGEDYQPDESQQSGTNIRTSDFESRVTRGLFKDYLFKRVKPWESKPGDIALHWFQTGSGTWIYHAMLVTADPIVKSGYGWVKFSAHTSDRYDYTWKYKKSDTGKKEFHIYRITEKIKTLKLGSNFGELNAQDSYSKYGKRTTARADLYKFEVETNGIFIFHQASVDKDLDSWLTLLDSKKRKLSYDDDNKGKVDVGPSYKRDSVIKKYLEKGIYYLEASSYGSNKYGRYDLSVLGQSVVGHVIGLDEEIDSELTTQSDESKHRDSRYAKTYTLELYRATSVIIKLDMSDSMDAYLYVRKQGSSSYIARDDDTGRKNGMSRRDSYIEKTFRAGVYEIEVTTYGRGKTGNFTLSVEEE